MTRRLAVTVAVLITCLFALAAWVSRLVDGIPGRVAGSFNRGRA